VQMWRGNGRQGLGRATSRFELVAGRLDGRAGTFVLQHSGSDESARGVALRHGGGRTRGRVSWRGLAGRRWDSKIVEGENTSTISTTHLSS